LVKQVTQFNIGDFQSMSVNKILLKDYRK